MKKNYSIDKEEFFKILEANQNQNERIDKLEEAGLSIFDSPIIEYGNFMFDKVINAYFTEMGVEWIYWWLYEKNGDPETNAWDKNNNIIPMESKEDLYNYIKQYRK